MWPLTEEVWPYCRYNFGTDELPLILMSYCTPIAPGRSRLLYCLAGERDKVPKKIQRIVDLVPGWAKFVNHFTRGDVLDGDNVFLHGIVSPSCCVLAYLITESAQTLPK